MSKDRKFHKILGGITTSQAELDNAKVDMIVYIEARLKALFELNNLTYQGVETLMSREQIARISQTADRIRQIEEQCEDSQEEEAQGGEMQKSIANIFN